VVKEAICFKCLQDFFVTEDSLSYIFLIIVHFFREPSFERYKHFGIKAGLIAMFVSVQVNNAFTKINYFQNKLHKTNTHTHKQQPP